jgi:hypothetical protein
LSFCVQLIQLNVGNCLESIKTPSFTFVSSVTHVPLFNQNRNYSVLGDLS